MQVVIQVDQRLITVMLLSSILMWKWNCFLGSFSVMQSSAPA